MKVNLLVTRLCHASPQLQRSPDMNERTKPVPIRSSFDIGKSSASQRVGGETRNGFAERIQPIHAANICLV